VHGNLTFKADFLVAHITDLVRELRIVNHVVSAIFRWTSNYIIEIGRCYGIFASLFCRIIILGVWASKINLLVTDFCPNVCL